MSKPQDYPTGWDEAQIRDLITHYDNQTKDEEAAEIEAGLAAEGITMIPVPAGLVDEVRALIARRQSA